MAEVENVDEEVQETSKAGQAEEAEETEDTRPTRSAEADEFWAEVGVDPVEIALPRGVGYTLRAYRSSKEVEYSEVEREEDDFSALERSGAGSPVDDDLDAELAAELDELDLDADDLDLEEDDEDEADDPEEGEEGEESETDEDEDDEEEEEAVAAEVDDEEIPVFLGHGGRLYLFRNAEALVEFVRSDAPNEMTQIEGWQRLKEKITADSVLAAEEDRYELDLVVENLRGGPDVWQPDLIIRAGELARDLGHALRLTAVQSAVSTGSPLDDLDEALRATTKGGLGGFLARRRLKKIGAQQAALGWRTIIGKISAATDWRD